MKIPNQLKIGAFIWDIKIDDNVAHEGSVYGSTHSKSQTIFLDPNTTKQHLEEILLHEALHSIVWQTGLYERLKSASGISEEEIVSTISPALYQLLIENKLDFGEDNEKKS